MFKKDFLGLLIGILGILFILSISVIIAPLLLFVACGISIFCTISELYTPCILDWKEGIIKAKKEFVNHIPGIIFMASVCVFEYLIDFDPLGFYKLFIHV